MNKNTSGPFFDRADVAVIGAGHAGIEAALACARMGLDTVLFTMSLDAVGNMPCNPSVGGTGKGHLVFEIDALGGEMGYAADCVTLQSRMLNLGKGPAVHSKRIQADRQGYRLFMKKTLEQTPGLRLVQAEIIDFACTAGNDGLRTVTSVTTRLGDVWGVRAVIVCAGTYLNGRVIVGQAAFSSGPDNMLPAAGFSDALAREGIRLMRFKTGTPARIHRRSIDFSQLEVQEGEEHPLPFSVRTPEPVYAGRPRLFCHVVYTTPRTHEIIRENLHRSPLYTGMIEGTGPRYCPSIEDKVVRFADKERHQLFVEPMGLDTDEMYLQGFSSSLPVDVQREMLRSLAGFEAAEMMRPAYAIEYDCADPTQMYATLEFKEISGLYGAGQFNGTSGYEEAAAQGLVAGINAALKLKGMEPLILSRDSSYIGTLIDDLVTKGTREPYRIMTSRSEYRLLLRQDNADARLTPVGRRIGLISEERYEAFLTKQEAIRREISRAETTVIPVSDELSRIMRERGTEMRGGQRLGELLRRPQLDYDALAPVDTTRPPLSRPVLEAAQVCIKYDGYIQRQLREVEKMKKMEEKRLPQNLPYESIKGLRLEAAQKLAAIRPANLGQASRISGISPADISVLLIWLKHR